MEEKKNPGVKLCTNGKAKDMDSKDQSGRMRFISFILNQRGGGGGLGLQRKREKIHRNIKRVNGKQNI